MLANVHMKEMDELTKKTNALEKELVTAKQTIDKQKAKPDYIGEIKPSNIFKCDQCDVNFKSEKSLNGHTNRKHGGNAMKLTTLI